VRCHALITHPAIVFCRPGLQERKLVKELVEQEGKRNVWLLRVLLRTWLVRFLIVIFYVTCWVIRSLSRVYIVSVLGHVYYS